MLNQQFQEPWVAIVVDPIQTMSSGKVNLGAFRTYPEVCGEDESCDGVCGKGESGDEVCSKGESGDAVCDEGESGDGMCGEDEGAVMMGRVLW